MLFAEPKADAVDSGPDRLLSLEEVCRKLGGVKPWTVRAWVSQRRIPFTKVGRLTRFPERGIDLWIRHHTVMPLADRPGP